MTLGATFSHHELRWLKINLKKALQAYHSLNFNWVRLALYWNETEIKRNNFDFSPLDQLISSFDSQKTNIVLSLGIKAPRWPEYYLPSWLQTNLKKNSTVTTQYQSLLERTHILLEKTIARYQSVNSIKVWQIENEPLDPSGPQKWSIHPDFLTQEVNLAKRLDPSRPILINLWANELSKRNNLKKALPLADIIGLDLYPTRYHSFFNSYSPPSDSPQKITRITQPIIMLDKKLWITELQTEPWESDHWKNLTKYPSFPPTNLQKNYHFGRQFQPETILFWGFEFWLFQKLQGNPAYWQAITSLLRKTSPANP